MRTLLPLLLAMALMGCAKEEETPPAPPPLHTVRYEVDCFGTVVVGWKEPDGTYGNRNVQVEWDYEFQAASGTHLVLYIGEYVSASARILVDGDTLDQQTNGGDIYLEAYVP